MTVFVALLRAVNVGGTGKLPMADLIRVCERARLQNVRTYIASGNVLFESDWGEEQIKTTLERALRAYTGNAVGVVVRTAAELAKVVANNPFPGRPGNRTVAIFLDAPPPSNFLKEVRGQTGEVIIAGKREIYIWYDESIAQSRLRIPAAEMGTSRNMNTVTKLAELAAGMVSRD